MSDMGRRHGPVIFSLRLQVEEGIHLARTRRGKQLGSVKLVSLVMIRGSRSHRTWEGVLFAHTGPSK
jgi:hypothetical protein